MMKKIFIVALYMFFLNNYAQSVFDKYDNKQGVNSILVNKKMFLLMANVKVDASDSETQKYFTLIKKLDDLKVFTTSSATISTDMKLTAENYKKTHGLDEVINTNEDGKALIVWIKNGNLQNPIKELFMYSEESNQERQAVLMTLQGSFDINEVAIVMKKMKIPGADLLKKMTKKN